MTLIMILVLIVVGIENELLRGRIWTGYSMLRHWASTGLFSGASWMTFVRQKWSLVSNANLKRVFESRINPPKILPGHFDFERRIFNAMFVNAIPV
jgi:hypothetical protein